MKRLPFMLLYFPLYFFTLYGIAQDSLSPIIPPMSVGDHAPQLKIEKWIKGSDDDSLRKGKVYLIDFWATWCVPCIATMPHLSKLKEKYTPKGLEVIGVTSYDKYGNTDTNVKEFIEKKDTALNYNIAWLPLSHFNIDTGIWVHPWMRSTGSNNLPTTFIVDKDGIIVYIGDPFTVDKTLDEVMSGDYNIGKLKKNYLSGIRADSTLSSFISSLKANHIDSSIGYANTLLKDFPYIKPNTYLIMAWQIAHYTGEVNAQLLQLGYTAVTQGIKQTDFSSPAFFDVLAAIYAAKKDFLAAVIAEKVAVGLSEGEMKKNQTKTLEKYLSLIKE